MLQKILFLLLILSLSACTLNEVDKDKPLVIEKTYIEATQVSDKTKPVNFIPLPYPVASAKQFQLLPKLKPGKIDDKWRKDKIKKIKGTRPASLIDQANILAKQMPHKKGFFNSIMQYEFMPGALYQLYAAPQRLTDIMLQPGEKLISKAAGDTTRWIVGETTSGSGEQLQTHIFVKPVRDGLQTSLLLTTDKRVYHIEMTSYKKTHMAALNWLYPHEMYSNKKVQYQQDLKKYQQNVAPFSDLSNLDFGYTITGDNVVWKPTRVFDNGEKTFIHLPKKSRHFERPVLFITSQSDNLQLVNYRSKGDYYIVDRLFDSAELVVGEKDPIRVVITRVEKRDVQTKTAWVPWKMGEGM